MISITYNKFASINIRRAMFSSSDKVVLATAAAISDTTKNLRTHASREIRKHLNLTKPFVDRRIVRIFLSKYHGGIRIRTNRPISLANLTRSGRPQQRKMGVSYSIIKGQTTIIRSAFGPKITAFHGSVYVRAGKDRKPLNIKKYFNLSGDIQSLGIVARINNKANEFLRKNLKRRMNLMKLREEGKVKT